MGDMAEYAIDQGMMQMERLLEEKMKKEIDIEFEFEPIKACNNTKPIYYAHSIKIYNSKEEQDFLKFINKKYPNDLIINPNGDIKWKGSMQPYFDAIKSSKLVICTEYMEHVGRGVHDEILIALKANIPVKVIRKQRFLYFFKRKAFKNVKEVEIVNIRDWKVYYGKVLI